MPGKPVLRPGPHRPPRRPPALSGSAALLLLLLMILLLLAPEPASAARVGDVRFERAGSRAELTVRLDRRVEAASVFLLDGPPRLVVDLPGVDTGRREFPAGDGASRLRLGQFDPQTARLVVDLAAPMAIMRTVADAGRELVVELEAAEPPEFRRAVAAGRTTLVQPTIAAVNAVAQSVVTKPVRLVAARAAARPVVVIDPGHGGKDVGAQSVHEGRWEKEATLAIAKAVKRELDRAGRVRTVLTREDDRFLALGERVAVARAARADLFISIHADSAANGDASGATVYTLSEVASDKEAARLAAKENKSDIIAGIDLGEEEGEVGQILIDLAQRETMNASSAFAATMQREMQSGVPFRQGYHRFAGFRVLKAADVPAVLFETGYLTNPADARRLFSASGRKAIAVGVRRAVEAYFERRLAQR